MCVFDIFDRGSSNVGYYYGDKDSQLCIKQAEQVSCSPGFMAGFIYISLHILYMQYN